MDKANGWQERQRPFDERRDVHEWPAELQQMQRAARALSEAFAELDNVQHSSYSAIAATRPRQDLGEVVALAGDAYRLLQRIRDEGTRRVQEWEWQQAEWNGDNGREAMGGLLERVEQARREAQIVGYCTCSGALGHTEVPGVGRCFTCGAYRDVVRNRPMNVDEYDLAAMREADRKRNANAESIANGGPVLYPDEY